MSGFNICPVTLRARPNDLHLSHGVEVEPIWLEVPSYLASKGHEYKTDIKVCPVTRAVADRGGMKQRSELRGL